MSRTRRARGRRGIRRHCGRRNQTASSGTSHRASTRPPPLRPHRRWTWPERVSVVRPMRARSTRSDHRRPHLEGGRERKRLADEYDHQRHGRNDNHERGRKGRQRCRPTRYTTVRQPGVYGIGDDGKHGCPSEGYQKRLYDEIDEIERTASKPHVSSPPRVR